MVGAQQIILKRTENPLPCHFLVASFHSVFWPLERALPSSLTQGCHSGCCPCLPMELSSLGNCHLVFQGKPASSSPPPFPRTHNVRTGALGEKLSANSGACEV